MGISGSDVGVSQDVARRHPEEKGEEGHSEEEYTLYNITFRGLRPGTAYAPVCAINEKRARAALEKKLDEINPGYSSVCRDFNIKDSGYRTQKEGVVYVVLP